MKEPPLTPESLGKGGPARYGLIHNAGADSYIFEILEIFFEKYLQIFQNLNGNAVCTYRHIWGRKFFSTLCIGRYETPVFQCTLYIVV
jgi:hypothetical protein